MELERRRAPPHLKMGVGGSIDGRLCKRFTLVFVCVGLSYTNCSMMTTTEEWKMQRYDYDGMAALQSAPRPLYKPARSRKTRNIVTYT